jgi:16S rRNA (guanine527-N7)-methyltransferase
MSRADIALGAHRRLLDKWRKAMDLIGPGPAEPHFQDAIGAVEGLTVEGRWADLGSGAGFPGIALAALHADAEVLLVESRQKRAIFLKKVVAEARLDNARVVHGRTEALEDGTFDGIISRAYKPPRKFLADAERLLRPGGVAVMMLGDRTDHDLPLGWERVRTDRYAVADGFRVRTVARRTE